METYEVTKDCYVPVGPGTKFKHRGQLVSLDSADAEDLAGFVKKASKAKLKREGRPELDTPAVTAPEPAAVISTEVGQVISENSTPEPSWEVTSDAGDAEADHGRDPAEAE